METNHADSLGGVEDVVPKLVQKAKDTDDKLVAFVRERPLTALVAALAAGYVVGRVISRIG
jgi:hypothetical protein